VPWTEPADLPYDPARPLPMLGGIFRDGFLPKKVAPETLRALITPRGGEEVTPP
jgi:hypothetical protein